MYEELVGDLRYCDKGDCNGCRRYTKDTRFCNGLLRDAADAIEELSMKLHGDEAAIAGMKREIERMVIASKPRWIPVTERLPEEGVSVQVCFLSQGGKAQAVSERFVDNRNQSYWSGLCGMKPTYWMPLPEPPKEEA